MRIRPFAVLVLLSATLAVPTLPTTAQSEAPTKSGATGPIRNDRYGDPLPKGAIARLGTIRFNQPFPWSLAFSPDGKILASGGHDNRIRLWDPDTGKETRILEGHKASVYCIAFSGDGKLLVSGSEDTELRLWDVETGAEQRRFQGHTAPVYRIALSPNGKLLASGCGAGMLRLWDTETGKMIRTLSSDTHVVHALAFSPDGKYLAFHKRWDEGIQLVDMAEGKLVRTFEGHKKSVEELIFAADGRTLFSCSMDNTIRSWDVASGKELRRYGDGKKNVRCLALAPNGKTITYGTHPDGMVHIWDLAAHKDLVAPWKANPWCVVSIAYSPDSKKVAVGRDTIAIHETATGKRLNPPPENDSRVQQVEYAADGKLLAVWRQDETIEVWETATWRKAATIKADTGRFTSMAFSPGGKYLTTAEGNFKQGVVCHWDPQTGKRQREFPQGRGWIEALSYSADGETLACIHMNQNSVLILWDPATGKERGRIPQPINSGRNPRLSPDGRLIACGTPRSAMVLWDAKTEKVVRAFGKLYFGTKELLMFSPDGKTIATPGGNVDPRNAFEPDVILWETATGQERLRITMNEGQVMQIAFSPDGRLLASVGRTETIFLWDAWTGKEVGRFSGHRDWISSLSFSPDGKTLASGGADSTVLIWDVTGMAAAAKMPAEKLGTDDLTRYWDDLKGTEAARAYRTIAELARRPGQAASLLKDKLAANPGVNTERLARLIADLNADDFNAREKASAELTDLGDLAEGALTRTLSGSPSAEVRRRVRELLDKLAGKAENPERHRLLRAVEILERLGTPDALRLLSKLDKEATVADVSREAKASLERLGKGRKGAP